MDKIFERRNFRIVFEDHTLVRDVISKGQLPEVLVLHGAEAYEIPFSQGFTEIIRRPRSWAHSDAWKLLAQFTGRLLVIAGENDEVIPLALIMNRKSFFAQT